MAPYGLLLAGFTGGDRPIDRRCRPGFENYYTPAVREKADQFERLTVVPHICEVVPDKLPPS
jgi:hypothetical protein